MSTPPPVPSGGYRPTSRAGRIAVGLFVAACIVTLVVVLVVKA